MAVQGDYPRQASEARTEAHRAGDGHAMRYAFAAYVAIGVSAVCALVGLVLCAAVIGSMVYVAGLAIGL